MDTSTSAPPSPLRPPPGSPDPSHVDEVMEAAAPSPSPSSPLSPLPLPAGTRRLQEEFFLRRARVAEPRVVEVRRVPVRVRRAVVGSGDEAAPARPRPPPNPTTSAQYQAWVDYSNQQIVRFDWQVFPPFEPRLDHLWRGTVDQYGTRRTGHPGVGARHARGWCEAAHGGPAHQQIRRSDGPFLHRRRLVRAPTRRRSCLSTASTRHQTDTHTIESIQPATTRS